MPNRSSRARVVSRAFGLVDAGLRRSVRACGAGWAGATGGFRLGRGVNDPVEVPRGLRRRSSAGRAEIPRGVASQQIIVIGSHST